MTRVGRTEYSPPFQQDSDQLETEFIEELASFTTPEQPPPTFDPETERRLAELHPEVEAIAREHLFISWQAGLQPQLGSGLRSYAEQDELYARGRTQPGSVVTTVKGGSSLHNFGVAYDLLLFEEAGERGLARCISRGDHPDYQLAGQIAESLGLTWGGRWERFPDPSHFQLTEGLPVSIIRQRYEAGEELLPSVEAPAGSHEYTPEE